MVAAMQGTERLLTSAEVAARLGISKRTVHRRALSGEIPLVRKLHEPNGAFLFDPMLIEHLARQSEKAAS